MERCIACELISGATELPGGRIFQTTHWVVEPCIGPLEKGTTIVKPFRHCVHVADLDPKEAAELGPLLSRTAACVQELTSAEQVYVCLWSHADWKPGHIHFVVQPVWAQLKTLSKRPGATLQAAQFSRDQHPSPHEIEAFCIRARTWRGWPVANR